MAKIGVSGFRYALQTADTSSTLTYGTPVLVPGVVAIDVKTGKDQTTLLNHADMVANSLHFRKDMCRNKHSMLLCNLFD